MEDIFGEPIYTYTSEQAADDGILFDIIQVNPEWAKGLFRYVTMNLMEHGYLTDDEVNIPNLMDLLIQSTIIIRDASNGFKDKPDTFYSGNIEMPSGRQQKVFISMNEYQKYTIMLPEDY
ncbi:hypothetical protein RE474_12610 [Methanolobus sediminis]|uniref:Uncharacterized protein n=1 Tax=Methanolobus sediminis TaxID=3072978 RepID=A0AA51UJX3_9EURY|nr:hypothetical protein [Methanolobus sediminis]WMW24907.1 hypothetical protein RE474_12610 [Methanolobus sediminis]